MGMLFYFSFPLPVFLTDDNGTSPATTTTDIQDSSGPEGNETRIMTRSSGTLSRNRYHSADRDRYRRRPPASFRYPA